MRGDWSNKKAWGEPRGLHRGHPPDFPIVVFLCELSLGSQSEKLLDKCLWLGPGASRMNFWPHFCPPAVMDSGIQRAQGALTW